MRKSYANAIVFGIGVITIVYFSGTGFLHSVWAGLGVALAVNIISAPVGFGLVEFFYNLKRLNLLFLTKLKYRNKDVRLSLSYVFQIKVKGKYLLVKNSRKDYYQPVGGVYKTLPGSERIFKDLNVKPDRVIETTHGVAKNDLRVTVQGKNVIPFLDWFHTKEDREISQWREFCEELLTTKFLPPDPFRYIDYKYIGTVQKPMRKAKNINSQEILLFEVYELILNDEQRPILEALCDAGDTPHMRWADETLIEGLGHDPRTKTFLYDIGAHAKWTLKMKWTGE